MRIRFHPLLPLLFLAVGTLGAAPAGIVLSRLGDALTLLEKPAYSARCIMTTILTISDTKGKPEQTIELVERLIMEPGRELSRETLSRSIRSSSGLETDAGSSASRQGEGGTASGWKLIFPSGSDQAYFSFGLERREGAYLSCDFSPANPLPPGAPREGLTRGTITWDPVTGQPHRFSAIPVKNPQFTSEFSLEYVFAVSGGAAYPKSIHFKGEGGFLFIRRRFESISAITEFMRGADTP